MCVTFFVLCPTSAAEVCKTQYCTLIFRHTSILFAKCKATKSYFYLFGVFHLFVAVQVTFITWSPAWMRKSPCSSTHLPS